MSDIWSGKSTILVGPATKKVGQVRRSDEFRHLCKKALGARTHRTALYKQ